MPQTLCGRYSDLNTIDSLSEILIYLAILYFTQQP